MPAHDPIVVYAVVTALIAALAAGIFFATPYRTLLTGPDEPPDPPAPPQTTTVRMPDRNSPAK